MSKNIRVMILVGLLVMAGFPAQTADLSKEQIKGLDEQVQEIKADVIGIAAELNQLEEKLLYPSDSQLAVFVALAEGQKFRLDSVEIQVAGKPLANHLYTFKELEALKMGGVQRIYTGNLRTGDYEMQVTLLGKSEGGVDFSRTKSFRVSKNVGPKIVELTLAGPGSASELITLQDW